MNNDFKKPQRQSIIGILVLFFYTLQEYAKALWPILVISIFKFNEINKTYFILGSIIIITAIAAISYLKYLNFTFYISSENDTFIITEGIFNKTKTTIQLEKIQQVNINQSLIQKIVGVFELRVDTAGTNKKEVEIKAISQELAIELKLRLLQNEKIKPNEIHFDTNQNNEADSMDKKEEIPHVQISFLSLLKIGITSNYVKSFFILFAFFITVSDHIKQITGKNVLHEENIENYVEKSQIVNVFLFFLFLFFSIVIAFNLLRTVLKFFNFKIALQKGSLLLSFGLFNTKSIIVKPEKVQIITITQNYFQKKLNVLNIKIKQANGGEKESQNAVIEIPGCNKMEKKEILNLLFQKTSSEGVRLKPNYRKLGFSIFITIVLPLIAFYFIRDIVITKILLIDYLVFFLVAVIGLIQFYKYNNNRLFINDDCIILQSGAWDISKEIIQPNKIQAISTSQLFWHKNVNIGSITLHTAGGNIAFQLGNFTVIKKYINLWLYEIETSDSNWM